MAQLYRGGSFLIANNSFAGNSLAELVLAARRKPNSINYASYGPGTRRISGSSCSRTPPELSWCTCPTRPARCPISCAER